tara:strand:- start:5178 stop:5312 length:135 start_codon:yes stop_codon:yes gene_type:complete
MRSWEEFFGGMRIRQMDITSLFLPTPVQGDVKTEKFAIANPKKM